MITASRKASSHSHRVLLVDDIHHGNLVRKVLLEDIGLAVEMALSAEAGWEMYLQAPHDLVVTDFRLPGMSGTDLIALIRESGHPTRTILLTGLTFLGLTEESTGADVVLWKCNKEGEQLQRTARQLLARRPRRKPVGSEGRERASVARSG